MNTVQQLTVRGVDAQTKRALEAQARQRGMSLNAYNLELLKRQAGTAASETQNGLQRFVGVAPLDTRTEAALHEQRKPKPDKWESYGL